MNRNMTGQMSDIYTRPVIRLEAKARAAYNRYRVAKRAKESLYDRLSMTGEGNEAYHEALDESLRQVRLCCEYRRLAAVLRTGRTGFARRDSA